MSGALLVWTIEEHYKSSNLPTFATHKKMKDTIIQVSKPKNKFPLLYRWTIGHGPIISFAFSPDTQHIAVASQDGFLRVYNFHKMEFYSRMRSYFGGFLCVCWSPDGKYVVGGSEDDLVSVWSFNDKRVVTRGEGHQSYINAVSFDPYALENNSTLPSFLRSESEVGGASLSLELKSQRSSRYIEEDQSYRVGSVGQDGIMCLWELSGDNLTIQRRGGRGQLHRGMSKQFSNSQHYEDIEMDHSRKDTEGLSEHKTIPDPPLEIPPSPVTNNKSESNTSKQTKKKRKGSERSVDVEMTSPIEPAGDLTMGGMGETSSISSDSSKEKKKNKHNQMNKIMKSNMVRKVKNLVSSGSSVPNRHISPFESCQSDDIAPKMSEINVIEPLVIKKIHNERLTDITFRDDCMLVATEDGYIQFWARPDYSAQPVNSGINSPKPGGSDGKQQQHTTINSPKLNNDNLNNDNLDGKQTSV
jgi:WD40 repeat protein